jgi:hypothetical protein
MEIAFGSPKVTNQLPALRWYEMKLPGHACTCLDQATTSLRGRCEESVPRLECGLNIKNFNDIKVGDHVEAFEMLEVKRTLEG